MSGNQGNDVCLAMLITYKEYLDIIIFEPDNICIVSFPREKLLYRSPFYFINRTIQLKRTKKEDKYAHTKTKQTTHYISLLSHMLHSYIILPHVPYSRTLLLNVEESEKKDMWEEGKKKKSVN